MHFALKCLKVTSADEMSDESPAESTPEAADVPENETSFLEGTQGYVTCSDIILNLAAANGANGVVARDCKPRLGMTKG